jgi:hypothetical protein
MDVPEARIHQAGSGLVPGRYALAILLLLVAKGAFDDTDDRRPRVRVPAECTVRRKPEVLDEEVRLVVLDRPCQRWRIDIFDDQYELRRQNPHRLRCLAAFRAGFSDLTEGGAAVHGWMNGWDWFWMTFMMIFWIAVLGAVVYAAVRLAQRERHQ